MEMEGECNYKREVKTHYICEKDGKIKHIIIDHVQE